MCIESYKLLLELLSTFYIRLLEVVLHSLFRSTLELTLDNLQRLSIEDVFVYVFQ